MNERRSNLDRRSNWNDALERLKLQDNFLMELDDLLNDMQQASKILEEEKNLLDSDISYWKDRIFELKSKYKEKKDANS